MNENIKNEIVKFAMDLQALCDAQRNCEHCPLNSSRGGYCKGGFLLHEDFDPETTIAAVEAYRKDPHNRILDEYTIKVEVERNSCDVHINAEVFADDAKRVLSEHYRKAHKPATVSVLSVKRCALNEEK